MQVRDFAVWRFAGGTVAEISTIQDQIALLKQIGYLPEDVRAAQPCPAAEVAPAQEVRRAPDQDLLRAVGAFLPGLRES